MNGTYFITGTGTDVGKTVVSAAILQGALALGHAATYWKPIQAGYPTDTDTVRTLVDHPGLTMVPSRHIYQLAASPDQAAEAEGQSGADLQDLIDHWPSNQAGINLIEGAGGLLVPFNQAGQTWADFLIASQSKQPKIVVVGHSGLGTLNHTGLTVEALQQRGLSVAAIIFNGPEHPGNVKSLSRTLGAIPLFQFTQLPELNQHPQWEESCKHLATQLGL